MVRGPVEAAHVVPNYVILDAAPRPTREVLVEIIVLGGIYGRVEAEDRVDSWIARFIAKLRQIIEQMQEEGRHIPFAFNSSGTDYIQGSCYCEPGDSEAVKREKKNRAHSNAIFSHCRSITADQFEVLSGKILSLLGVEQPFVSRHTADQGIDFFGLVSLGQILKPSLLAPGPEKHLGMWLVGQAKHYPNTTVSTEEIRSLVGSVELARAGIYAGTTNPLADLTARLCDPLLFLFFTTGKFTRDSRELMRRAGVLSFDGMQIAQFLADKGIGQNTGVFDPALFDQWLVSAMLAR